MREKEVELKYAMHIIILVFIFTTSAFAKFDQSQINFGFGMINASFTETDSGLEEPGSKKEVLASGSVPVMGGFFEYEKFLSSKLSFTGKTVFPLMASPTGSYLSIGSGVNYYFSPISSTGSFANKDIEIRIIPKWRFYAGAGLGGAYLIYNTETAKKTDTLIEVFGNAGIIYSQNNKWGYRCETSLARGTGFNTSNMTMKLFLGLTYSLK